MNVGSLSEKKKSMLADESSHHRLSIIDVRECQLRFTRMSNRSFVIEFLWYAGGGRLKRFAVQ